MGKWRERHVCVLPRSFPGRRFYYVKLALQQRRFKKGRNKTCGFHVVVANKESVSPISPRHFRYFIYWFKWLDVSIIACFRASVSIRMPYLTKRRWDIQDTSRSIPYNILGILWFSSCSSSAAAFPCELTNRAPIRFISFLLFFPCLTPPPL